MYNTIRRRFSRESPETEDQKYGSTLFSHSTWITEYRLLILLPFSLPHSEVSNSMFFDTEKRINGRERGSE